MPRLYNAKAGVADSGDVVPAIALASADGAITPINGTVFITKGSAAALTLAAPTAAMNGMQLNIVSTTAYAHTVTNSSPGFNDGSTASDVGTFGAAKGNYIRLVAYNLIWWVIGNANVTLA
jgi:hypothetical protein